MPDKFFSPTSEDLQKIYVDDYSMIDQFALTGSLWLWGDNSSGALGNNAQFDRSSPVQTVSVGTNWKQVSIAGLSAAIKTDGTLWLWGNNDWGQLGNNARVTRSSPVQTVSGGSNWQQVSAGVVNTAAIKTDGTLWMWGRNISGQLGTNNTTDRSSPVQTVSGGSNWQLVSCGRYHTAAIKTDGTLWIWGQNLYGQLGDNTNGVANYKSSPVQTISSGTNWKKVSCGESFTAAIKTDGTLWLWGRNSSTSGISGQLGNNAQDSVSSPIQTISGGTNWKQVSCGTDTTAAIKTDGTLWMWGRNVEGQLGDNTNNNYKSSPVQTISGGTNWKQVSAGGSSTTAIKTDGTLWVWGSNAFNQLGINISSFTILARSSPSQTVSGGTNWKTTSSGGSTNSAIYFYDAGNLYPSS